MYIFCIHSGSLSG